MSKMHIRLIAVMALLVIVLAACGTAGTNVSPGVVTQPVPQTGATAGTVPGDTTGSECVGVDTEQLMTGGELVYTENCAGCHGAEGAGQGDFPALSANGNVTVGDLTSLVTTYYSVDAHPKDLAPQDLAGVFSFVRSSFGNTGTVVCPDQIMVPAP